MKRAVEHLRKADPVMGRVIDQVGRCRFAPAWEGPPFDAIARSIIYQQLSGKAASTILGRFCGLYGGRTPRPAELLATPPEALRAVGLSGQKAGYLLDLAAHSESGSVPFDALHTLDDAAIVEALTRVKGVGVWTAQMYLIFRLGRLDVLPDGDLGIRKAVQRAYQLRKLPDPARVRRIGAPWRPYATIASWYLWRSLD